MPRVAVRLAAALIGFVVVLAGAGCGSSPSTNADPNRLTGSIMVFAASSLTGSFNQIGKDFEAAHPGTKVVFNFAGSSTLATQINQGAPADAFAAASPTSMATVVDAGGASDAITFARNQLVIAVAKGNPHRVSGLADLPRLKVALCAPTVPCGAAAQKALAAAGVALTPVTQEPDVKSALAKLRLGEVDAALVYRSDVKSASSDVDGVEFPESAKATNDYQIVVLKNAPNPTLARAFVAFVRTEAETSVLVQAGFLLP